jgi:hypothetical protein
MAQMNERGIPYQIVMSTGVEHLYSDAIFLIDLSYG